MILSPEIITLLILLSASILFFTEIIPIPVTAMAVPVALSLTGIMESEAAFSYWGNQWVMLFLAMFIVGKGVFRTGFADYIGDHILRLAGGSSTRFLILIMFVIGIMSAFLNNTGTTAVFLPIVISMSHKKGLSPRTVLMPVAYAASLGGTMTVIGTPPNAIINSTLETYSLEAFGFFEFARVGGVMFAAGILFLTLGKRFLPENKEFEAAPENVKIDRGEIRHDKMKRSMAILFFVLVAMITGFVSLLTAAMLGAVLTIISGCITVDEAFSAVNWTTIFLFAGMLPLGTAMEKTGSARMIAEGITNSASHPLLIFAAIFLITVFLTNFMSNTATSALMAPIGIEVAMAAGMNPHPLLLGVAMASSCCFLTPVATPPNALVLGPADYSFIDYLKTGWLLQILVFLLAMIFIPLFFPF